MPCQLAPEAPANSVAASELSYQYIGTELDLFAQAVRWKNYLKRQITPFLGRRVLEVGAGIGGTTRVLFHEGAQHWLALEPDPQLAARYEQACEGGELPAACQVKIGTTLDIDPASRFDSVLYVDVLEHIEEDRAELARAAGLLAQGGTLVVLAPAHNRLMCDFDKAVGHFRRYSCRSLRDLAPPGVTLVRLAYLDSVGLLASLGNRVLLRRSIPTARQIAFWDGVLVRASTWLDPLCGYSIGKSVLAVWKRSP